MNGVAAHFRANTDVHVLVTRLVNKMEFSNIILL